VINVHVFVKKGSKKKQRIKRYISIGYTINAGQDNNDKKGGISA
jgi:hypothetical protein